MDDRNIILLLAAIALTMAGLAVLSTKEITTLSIISTEPAIVVTAIPEPEKVIETITVPESVKIIEPIVEKKIVVKKVKKKKKVVTRKKEPNFDLLNKPINKHKIKNDSLKAPCDQKKLKPLERNLRICL